ncbi:MAG: DUF6364 family protein [Bacteroidia bacterium]
MKNVTLSMPVDLLRKSREYARRHGTTLNQMIRDLLKRQVEKEESSVADAIIEHAQKTAVIANYKWNRENAYEK